MTSTTKEKLNAAFKTMQNAGLMARQNYGTGQGAGEALRNYVLDLPRKRQEKIVGLVHYIVVKDGAEVIYVNFDTAPEERCPNTKTAEQVGQMAFEALQGAGLVVSWNGDRWVPITVDIL